MRTKAGLTAVAAVGLGLVLAFSLSLYGRHEADRRAHTVEHRLAAAVAGVDQREAGTLLLRNDGGRYLVVQPGCCSSATLPSVT
jgi:hypothetical protein